MLNSDIKMDKIIQKVNEKLKKKLDSEELAQLEFLYHEYTGTIIPKLNIRYQWEDQNRAQLARILEKGENWTWIFWNKKSKKIVKKTYYP